MKISMNIGFVTNSSSVVHHFPKEVLDHPQVAAFIKAFELEDGFVGREMWRRDECTTIAMTRKQKEEVQQKLAQSEYGSKGPPINVDSDEVVIIYGDEAQSVANSLAHLMCQAMADIHGGDPWDYRNSEEYN